MNYGKNKDKHWKIKDTSNMHHPAWNKGLSLGNGDILKYAKKRTKKVKLAISERMKGNKNGLKENKLTFEESKQRRKEERFAIRLKVLNFYSKGLLECNCCKSKKYLEIDHIDGKGKQHRLEIFGYKCAGTPFCNWLIRNNFPKGYQILCRYCNKIKKDKKICPHKMK